MKYIPGFILAFLITNAGIGQNTNSKPEVSRPHISIEVQEVHELMFVIYALTDVGMSDSLMINNYTDYYKEVMDHFSSYREEKIVRTIGRKLRTHYNQLRMDAFNYHFDDHGHLTKSEQHKNISWGNRDVLKPYLQDLQKFSTHTGFREFYQRNEHYYTTLAQWILEHGAAEQQTTWLETSFPIKHNRYTIVFSPLSYGMHATNYQLEDVIVFVSAPDEKPNVKETLFDAQVTRMIFTEIDHNFVNPISDEYKAEIKKAFSDRKKWTAGKFTDSYVDEYAVFNEYMTWALFVLYVLDTYSTEDFYHIKTNIVATMVEYRGFIHFQWFVDQLIELYLQKGKKGFISDLFPEVLSRCERE